LIEENASPLERPFGALQRDSARAREAAAAARERARDASERSHATRERIQQHALVPQRDGDGASRWQSADAPVSLLHSDPEFAACVPRDQMRLAERLLQLPQVRPEPGRWEPPSRTSWVAPVSGMILVEGLLSRAVGVGSLSAIELLGPGDFVHPWPAGDQSLPGGVYWMVHEPTRLAVLEGRFSEALRRWPSLIAVVTDRAALGAYRLAAQVAALHCRRVDERIVAVLWQLADRWGRVTTEGVVIPLQLTHRMLGQLVAAKRPTVSLALAELAAGGHVIRHRDGTWLLGPDSAALVGAGADHRPAVVRTLSTRIAG
jgi:hypothetical protein